RVDQSIQYADPIVINRHISLRHSGDFDGRWRRGSSITLAFAPRQAEHGRGDYENSCLAVKCDFHFVVSSPFVARPLSSGTESGVAAGCSGAAAALAEPGARALTTMEAVVAMGYFWSRHASIPPSKGRTRVNPYFCSNSATRAAVASFGQEQ